MSQKTDDETFASLNPSLQYVALPGQATGWTAMADTVRKFDEEKIDDCKDDIDTLLVFVSLSRTTA